MGKNCIDSVISILFNFGFMGKNAIDNAIKIGLLSVASGYDTHSQLKFSMEFWHIIYTTSHHDDFHYIVKSIFK